MQPPDDATWGNDAKPQDDAARRVAPPEESTPERIGHFRIERQCGRGGASVVYEAVDEEAGQKVALKILGADLAGGEEAQTRIEREEAILGRIRHPHVAHLLRFGRTPDGRLYQAFEFVEGTTLQEIIEQRATVDWGTALGWMIQAAEALAAAWRHHIIHRDLKPGNIMIDQASQLKLVDFGLAKAIYEPADPGARREMLLGTPRYMSPEMATGQSLDFRADMYSLGATFYHLLVGQVPFEGDSLMAIAKKHAHEPLIPPSSLQPNLPHDVSDILVHLMQKDPARRYQSYDDLIADLREARLAILTKHHTAGSALFENPAEGDPSLVDPRLGLGHLPIGAGPELLGPMPARPEVAGVNIDSPREERRHLFFGLIGAAILVVVVGVYFSRGARGVGSGAQPGPVERFFSRVGLKLGMGPGPRASMDQLVVENKERLERVMGMLNAEQVRTGQWPRRLDDLVATESARPENFKDIWGGEMAYDQLNGKLSSPGPDGKLGTPDDFTINSSMNFEKLPDPDLLMEHRSKE